MCYRCIAPNEEEVCAMAWINTNYTNRNPMANDRLYELGLDANLVPY